MSTSNNQEKVTAYQSYMLLIMTIIGTGILSLPRRLAADAGNHGLWVVWISGFFAWVMMMIITHLCQRFPQQSFVEYSRTILGSERFPWLGRIGQLIVVFLMMIAWFVALAMVTRLFGEVIVSSILHDTPIEVILFSFLLFTVPIAASKIELVAKFNELLFPFLIIPLILGMVALYQQGDVCNLLPFIDFNARHVIKGIFDSTIDFYGFNTLLVFMASYQQLREAKRRHTRAILIITVVYFLSMVISTAIFGAHTIEKMLWPTLENVRPINLPIQIFERLESGMISVWMVISFTTLVNILSALVDTWMRTFRYRESNRKWTALLLILPVYLLSLLPKSFHQLNDWMPKVGYYFLAADFFIPLLLLIIAVLRKKKGEKAT